MWEARTSGSITATPLVVGDRVYAASSDGLVYAFPRLCAGSGGLCPALWVGRTGGPLKEQPVVATGLVYVTSTDGNMYVFADAADAVGTRESERAPLLVEPIGPLPPRPTVWGDRALVTIAADGTLSAWTVDGVSLDRER